MSTIETPEIKSEQMLSRLFMSRIESKTPQCRTVAPVQFVVMLNQGVSGTVLGPMAKHIPKHVVVSTVGSDSSNFSKLLQRRLSGRQTEDLNDLTKLWAELREFFDWDENKVKAWINDPLPSLDGESPSVIMSSQEGRDIIREQLEQMRYGDFS